MSTREELLKRPDIQRDDLDDVIAIAARLQDEDREREARRVGVGEVEAVASELNIDPRYVEEAIEALKGQREEAAAQKEALDAAARARSAQLRRWALAAAASMFSIGLLTFGVGALGARDLRDATANVELMEARLGETLERQATLTPSLVALAGGETRGLSELAARVSAEGEIQARMEASRALNAAMVEALSSLPPPGSDAEAQSRLNLQYEITGSQNRVSTEARRYEEARAAWERDAATFSARIAAGLGLVEAP